MNRSFTRWATFAMAGFTVVFCSTLAVPAQAQATLTYGSPGSQLTYTDANCPTFIATPTGNNVTITCGTAPPPPPGAPTHCVASVSTNPSPLTSAGGTATPSVACDSPPAGSTITYSWTKSGSAFSCNTSQCSPDNLPANTTASNQNYSYKPTPCIGGACATVSAATATVPGSGGGGGGGGPISCAGFSKTVVVNENWALTNFPRLYTQNFGTFGGNDALVIHFKTGNLSAPGKQGSVQLIEYGSPPSGRHATLSTSPCDFGEGLQPPYSSVNSGSIQLYYSVGGTPVAGGYPVLNTGTDYYVNIINISPAACQQPPANGVCDMSIDFGKPRGL